MLKVECVNHPKYKAERPPKECGSCAVLFYLRHQHTDMDMPVDWTLHGMTLADYCADLKVTRND